MENLATFVPKLRTDFNPDFCEQFFAQELKHHYNLHQRKQDVPTTVFFVLWLRGKQVKVSTGLKVYPRHWQNGRAKIDSTVPYMERNNNLLLNERLNTFDIRFEQYKRLVNEGALEVDRNNLKQYITTGTMAKKQKEPKDVAKVLLQYLYKDTTLSSGTKENQVRFINNFGKYLSTKIIYDYEDITFETMLGFQQWCIENIQGRKGKRASSESINKIVDSIYGIIKKYLVYNRLMSGSHFADIEIQKLDAPKIDDEIALREDELTLLYNYHCADVVDEEIKDLFLLECTTGQRFSDIEKLDDLIEQQDGRTYFNLVQKKTKAKVEVGILFQMTLDILKKYSYRLPSHNNSVFNKHIKKIAKDAGITGQEIMRHDEAGIAGVSEVIKPRYECVSSHTGRRTFVTMLRLRGWTDSDIAKYTAHSSLYMIQLYDKAKNGSKIKDMFEQLKVKRPECVLKMVSDTEPTTTTPAPSDLTEQLLQKIEQQGAEKEQLRQQCEQGRLKCEQLRGVAAVQEQISKKWKDAHYELSQLLEAGIPYDQIKAAYDQEDEMNHILDGQIDVD